MCIPYSENEMSTASEERKETDSKSTKLVLEPVQVMECAFSLDAMAKRLKNTKCDVRNDERAWPVTQTRT